MADEKKGPHYSAGAGRFVEKRREKRHRVSAVYRQQIKLRVRADDASVVPVEINDFSRQGILFVSPVPFNVDSYAECMISITQWLAKDISFGTRIKYCLEKDGSFIIGANIESIADAVWFEVFVEVHDFIVRRQGGVS